MSKQDSSKEAEQVQKVTPVQIKMGRAFYRSGSDERNIDEFSASEFDALALSFVDEIDNVQRDVWDVFARAKFLNWLVSEGDVRMTQSEGKFIFTAVPAEEKTSAPEMDRTA